MIGFVNESILMNMGGANGVPKLPGKSTKMDGVVIN